MTMKKVHPLAELYPDMTELEFGELCDSIKTVGLVDDITLWRDETLDGRHRDRACAKVGVEPRYTDFEGSYEEARDLVVARNKRRNLTEGQKAMVADKVAADMARRGVSGDTLDLGAKRLGIGRATPI